MVRATEESAARRSAALFRRGAFTRQQAGARRWLAIVLVLLSAGGAVLWGGGGTAAWLALAPVWWGVAGALALQVAFTYGQWVFGGPGWWNPLYLLCLCGSALTTVLGYWPIVHPPLARWLRGIGPGAALGYYAPWLAGAIIVLAALVIDWLPEQTLLD